MQNKALQIPSDLLTKFQSDAYAEADFEQTNDALAGFTSLDQAVQAVNENYGSESDLRVLSAAICNYHQTVCEGLVVSDEKLGDFVTPDALGEMGQALLDAGALDEFWYKFLGYGEFSEPLTFSYGGNGNVFKLVEATEQKLLAALENELAKWSEVLEKNGDEWVYSGTYAYDLQKNWPAGQETGDEFEIRGTCLLDVLQRAKAQNK